MNLPRLLIILDLDETLIHATSAPTVTPSDFIFEEFHVRQRPFVVDFLRRLSVFVEIAIWSSATDDYVQAITSHIIPKEIPLRFVWGRSRCICARKTEHSEDYWIKDLKKVKKMGYSLERILIVDDSPEKIEQQYGNHVFIEPFNGDTTDQMLPRLADYLEKFAHTPNVRKIEKRGWHEAGPVIPTAELLATFGQTLGELRRRGICRSENIPTGDFAEYLACKAFSLKQAANANKGYDATDSEGKRYQIKGRRITIYSPSTQLGVLRDLETDSFDFLIVILFDAAYRVTAAYRITIDACRKHGRFVKWINGHIIYANRAMIDHADTSDITVEILEAYGNAD